jgi:hypothetical protein
MWEKQPWVEDLHMLSWLSIAPNMSTINYIIDKGLYLLARPGNEYNIINIIANSLK